MTYVSAPGDLALHGVRVLGFPAAARIATRYRIDAGAVQEALLDFEARGWVSQVSFGGTSGWSMTEAGRAEDERRLAAELAKAGARDTVSRAHTVFLPLNRRLGDACTKWQIRATRADPMAFNDHTDWRWDERVLQALASIGSSFKNLCEQLAGCLARFDAYAGPYASALSKAQAGHRDWVDGHDRDSCHLVWIQFHEDLLATLGMPRGTDT